MAETLHCPDCDSEIESTDELEHAGEVTELETGGDDDSVGLYGNRDLFLCSECKRPLGVGRSD